MSSDGEPVGDYQSIPGDSFTGFQLQMNGFTREQLLERSCTSQIPAIAQARTGDRESRLQDIVSGIVFCLVFHSLQRFYLHERSFQPHNLELSPNNYASDISFASVSTLSCIATLSSRALANSASSFSMRSRAAVLELDSGAVHGLEAAIEGQMVAAPFFTPLERSATEAELPGRNEYIDEMSLQLSFAGLSRFRRPSNIAHSTSTYTNHNFGSLNVSGDSRRIELIHQGAMQVPTTLHLIAVPNK